jgi:hypothetical protein
MARGGGKEGLVRGNTDGEIVNGGDDFTGVDLVGP